MKASYMFGYLNRRCTFCEENKKKPFEENKAQLLIFDCLRIKW